MCHQIPLDSSSFMDALRALQEEISQLERKVRDLQAENDAKDELIESLKLQLVNQEEMRMRSENLQDQLNSYMRNRLFESEEKIEESFENIGMERFDWDQLATAGLPERQDSNSLPVRDIVDEIQRWLFLEGGNLRDVESLISEYCNFLRSIGIPLDRLFIAGMMLHSNVSAYVWKWEKGEEFQEHEVPHSAFQKPNYNPDEPFAVLLEGRAMQYRMNAETGEIPPGCAWFTNGQYQDYYALPIYHRGEFKGAMAWSTKHQKGWNEEHVLVFERSLAALSTVLRLYTNDIVTKTLTGRLEEEVQRQVNKLATANQDLAQANAKVVQQSKSQLRHFAMMSHEIRTPLNCIVGLSNLLLESPHIDPAISESIEMITASGDLLLAVVNDVLDYSKLSDGKVDTVIGQCRLHKVIWCVVYAVQAKAASMGVEIRAVCKKNLPALCNTDSRRVQQILYNLLGNAIKFGKAGGVIDFTASVVNNAIHFSIKDYGKGIPTAELNTVFEPFRQSSNNKGGEDGTGLGLAITRQLVDALEGTIAVQSEYGLWCEFTVTLPLNLEEISSEAAYPTKTKQDYASRMEAIGLSDSSNESLMQDPSVLEMLPRIVSMKPESVVRKPTIKKNDSTRKKRSKSDSSLSFKGIVPRVGNRLMPRVENRLLDAVQPPEGPYAAMRVLIAEDNLINQKVLTRSLRRIGIVSIDVVGDGELAVEASAKKEYDVIFMDMSMPRMDGLEATRIISERPNHPKIVFLTAHALQEFRDQAADAGADGFISKPFKIDIIKNILLKFHLMQSSLTEDDLELSGDCIYAE